MNKETILIVEDERLVAQDIKNTLERMGYKILPLVATGEEALRIAEEFKPDLILMDIYLAGEMDGITAAEEIISKYDIPIIYLTAYADEKTLQRAKETSPYSYITKPFTEQILRINVEIAIYKHAADINVKESEERFRAIFREAGDAIFIHDVQGNFLAVNEMTSHQLGYSQDEFRNMSIYDINTPFSAKANPERIEKTLRRKFLDFEAMYQAKDGRKIPVEVNSRVIYENNEKVILCIARDITQRKLVEEANEQHKAELRTLMEISRQLSEVLDFSEALQIILDDATKHLQASAGTIIISSQAMPQIIIHNNVPEHIAANLHKHCPFYAKSERYECVMKKKYTYQLPPNNDLLDHCPPLKNAGFQTILSSPIKDKNSVLGYIHLFRHKNKPFTQAEIQFLEIMLQQSTMAIKKVHLFEKTQHLSITDALTQLYNRHHLYTLGKYEYERARRYKTPLSALMIDADHFKKVNDTYGHAVGDQVLQDLARHLNNSTREVDILGRYGGEEFVILLPDTEISDAIELAERLRSRVKDEIALARLNDHPTLTISIGVSTLGADTHSLDALLDKADSALYEAKRTGRNKVVFLDKDA